MKNPLFYLQNQTFCLFFIKKTFAFCLLLGSLLSFNSHAQVPFITRWKTDNPGTSNSTSITIPTTDSGYLYDVDWNNDGTFDQFGVTGNVTHDYTIAGTYTVAIKGAFPRIYFNNEGDKSKILSVEQWGDIAWFNMGHAFYGCENLAGNASDAPILSSVLEMNSMFQGATVFNQDIGSWNVSAVTNMNSMFQNATAFNQNIGAWNVSAVTNMGQMFLEADAFNQNIGAWDVSAVTNMNLMFGYVDAFNQNIGAWNVSAVTNMNGMFGFATAFNQNIGAWNVSAVTNMGYMFNGATAFNQNIGAWNVSAVTNMTYMFYEATAFNQNIGAWNVSAVTDMNSMFALATAFNQTIGAWNVSAVTDMQSMFVLATAFNQDIGAWNVSAVTNMLGMFAVATAFNQDIENWDVSTVTTMGSMFYQASAFNQNIGAWNVSAVTDMSYMFYEAPVFNQNIGSWNVSAATDLSFMFYSASAFNQTVGAWNITNATSMSGIFNNSGLSRTNYDNILIAWNAAGYTNKNLGNASPLKYCDGDAARTNLVLATGSGGRGWTITSDALNCSVAAQMNIKGNSVSIFDGNTSPSTTDHTDFGTQNVPTGTVVRTFSIENTGDAALTLSGTPKAVLSGTNAADFTVTTQPVSPVAATNGISTFIITFDPSASGIRTARVSIANTDTYQNPYTFDIQGTGAVVMAPEIDIKGNCVSIVDGDITPNAGDHTDFGSQSVASGNIVRTFTIENTGGAALTLSGTPKVVVSGANAADFTVTALPTSPVAATNGTTTFAVTFDPSAGGTRSASISISNDDTDENPYNFNIQGTGTCTVSAPTGTSNPSICSNATASLSATCATGTVNWYGSNSTTFLQTGSPFVTPNLTTATTYNVRCDDGTCNSGFVAVNVSINALPVPAPSSNTPVCSGNSLNLSSVSSNTYSWSGPNSFTSTLRNPSISNVTIVAGGTYTITQTNSFGCTASATTSVTINSTPSSPTGTANPSICNNATASLSATCVSSTVAWYGSNSTTFLQTGSPYVTPNLTTATTYNVRCENGSCMSSFVAVNVSINSVSAPTGTANPTICNNTTTSLSASCATGTVNWYGSNSTTLLQTGSPFVTPNLTTATTYNVRCENSGCNSGFVAVNVTIETPPTVTILGGGELTCETPTLSLTATGGGSYFWNTESSNSTITVSAAGTYSVTVTSANGCTATASVAITQNISPPTATILGGGELTCSTTSISLTATGGGSYFWNNESSNSTITVSTSGTYSVTVTGENGCTATASVVITQNITPPIATILGGGELTCSTTSISLTATGGGTYFWNTESSNSTITVSESGTYSVTVTGANGCTATASVAITQNISPPTATILGGGQLTCTTTTLSLTATGGGSYFWNTESSNSTITVSESGTYSVTVTGVNGCTATATVAITQDILAPEVTILGGGQLTCSTTSISLTATGGGSYSWSNELGTNPTITVSASGTYSVTVTGANGCTATATVAITQDITPPTATITGGGQLTCSTTSISLTATGGGSYFWNNESSNSTLTVSASGTYSVTVTGENGCTATASVAITQNISPPTTTILGGGELTCSTTSISLTATGGGSYFWNNESSNSTLTVSASGTYSVTVTGENGCTATASVVITQNISPPTATITGGGQLTCSTTTLSLTATGGGSYAWSNGLGTNATVTVSASGTYSVTVTSANGCTATASVAIMITNNLVVTASNTGPYELGNTISLSASGGGFYTWRGPDDFLSTNANATILNATQVESGIYTVTVTNGSGCSATATTNVVVNPCSQMFKFDYVKAGPDFQFFFPITDGMNIAELPTLLSGTGIIATPICQLDTVNTASVRFQMTGPTPLFNRDVIENIYPYSPFENRWFQIFGPIFPPGEYTLTVTGYSQEFAQGIVMFGPQTIHFTITGSAPSIALVNPNISQICAGNNLNVSFETTGSFISGNKFEVQLSNATGSFELPLKIGESTTAGLVNCTIPGNIPAGNGYKIRVFATNPALMSSTFSSAFEINPRNLILQSPTDDISTMRNKTATEKITATNKVLIGGNSTYQAGRFVLLQAGFEANSGSDFKAEIGGCSN